MFVRILELRTLDVSPGVAPVTAGLRHDVRIAHGP